MQTTAKRMLFDNHISSTYASCVTNRAQKDIYHIKQTDK